MLAALLLTGCTTLHVHKSYDELPAFNVNHRERGYVVKYAYDLQPPEALIHREVQEAALGVVMRAGIRAVGIRDFSVTDTRLEIEYMKQVINMTIKDGCSIGREGDGSTKVFPVGTSANKFIITLRCENG